MLGSLKQDEAGQPPFLTLTPELASGTPSLPGQLMTSQSSKHHLLKTGLTFLEPAFILESLISKCLKYDEIQDPMPPNMGPWHIEHFKLKEFENCKAGRSL